jgi:hypothetical protein
MNQNIVGRAQHRTRHAQGKSDGKPGLQSAIQLKKHSAG